MQRCEHSFQRRFAGLLVGVDRDAAAFIVNRYRAVGLKCDVHRVVEAGHRFVDSVVDYFLNQMLKARGAGGPNVHAGPKPNGLESLHDIDISGGVFLLRAHLGSLGHEVS